MSVYFSEKHFIIPELTLTNLHPKDLPMWPYMFVTVACGAVSGFHATQSPMMAKCIKSEKNGRAVFYGAMICETVIALIWAVGGVAFYGATSELSMAINDKAVYRMRNTALILYLILLMHISRLLFSQFPESYRACGGNIK